MEISVERGRTKGRSKHWKVIVAGEVTIYEAAEAKAMLMQALQHASHLEIDLSRVSEIDTAGLQVLVLAKREALRAGREVRLVHGSASLDVLDCYGLGAYFGDPVVISSRERSRGKRGA